jgi:DeoR/GlpR family transcriptional regulator of sugar metabolism
MPVATEKHFSVAELAALWKVSSDTIRRIFAEMPGVLKIGHGPSKKARKYVTLRIPESVATRQHAVMTKGTV